jgi:hypothetical protein
MMKIYIKNEVWSKQEIQERSGSGMIVKEISTEKKSIIEEKVRSVA